VCQALMSLSPFPQDCSNNSRSFAFPCKFYFFFFLISPTLFPSLETRILLCFHGFTFLHCVYKWGHMVAVFLCLVYFLKVTTSRFTQVTGFPSKTE
jgi:hypothetical protein